MKGEGTLEPCLLHWESTSCYGTRRNASGHQPQLLRQALHTFTVLLLSYIQLPDIECILPLALQVHARLRMLNLIQYANLPRV